MERKLIKQGGGGFTIYLPKKWIENKGLKEGDEVKVTELENSLLIGGNVKSKEIIISIESEDKENIKNILTHSYRKGFDKITIKFKDPAVLKEIKKLINLLLGFEITTINSNSCVIENISEPTEGKYEIILRKVFLIITETQEEILESFINNDFTNFKEIEEMRNNLDKFLLFCRRLLTKEKYEKDLKLEWEFLTFLMHIDHAYYYFYKYCTQNEIKPEKEMINLLKNLKEYFSLFKDAYYNKDLKSIHKINNQKDRFQFGKCIDLIEKSKGKNAVVYSYLREIFRLIQIGTSPILSMNLNY